ncbi:carbohydrate porin [Pseudomonas gingeri]|uniref:carbohydrate porin n=1 Tax=Pseudomonas gingeri TaxID=117681 RepID=UPI002108D797|nr:carbohydrate porin [Pseudomonas gingeri]
MAVNLRGGYDKGHTARLTEQFTPGFKADRQKILGWENSQFQFTVTERDGRNLTNDQHLNPSLVISSNSTRVVTVTGLSPSSN